MVIGYVGVKDVKAMEIGRTKRTLRYGSNILHDQGAILRSEVPFAFRLVKRAYVFVNAMSRIESAIARTTSILPCLLHEIV